VPKIGASEAYIEKLYIPASESVPLKTEKLIEVALYV